MTTSAASVISDPRIPANAKGLLAVSVDSDATSVSLAGFSLHALAKEAKAILEDEGLKIDRKSKSRLIIGVAVESRANPTALVYAVEVILREPVGLPRDASDTVVSAADTWRHQAITGVLFPPFNTDLIGKSLMQEALRQVSVFARDWSENVEAIEEPETTPQPPTVPEPADEKFQKIKKKLEELLVKLAVGDDSCTVTIEKFDIAGTKVDFRATITHRRKNPHRPFGIGPKYLYEVDTTVEGSFDAADPASVQQPTFCTKLPPALGSQKVCTDLKDLAALF